MPLPTPGEATRVPFTNLDYCNEMVEANIVARGNQSPSGTEWDMVLCIKGLMPIVFATVFANPDEFYIMVILPHQVSYLVGKDR